MALEIQRRFRTIISTPITSSTTPKMRRASACLRGSILPYDMANTCGAKEWGDGAAHGELYRALREKMVFGFPPGPERR